MSWEYMLAYFLIYVLPFICIVFIIMWWGERSLRKQMERHYESAVKDTKFWQDQYDQEQRVNRALVRDEEE